MQVGRRDFERVESAATGFYDVHDKFKEDHEAQQPPKKPPTRAEIEYPTIKFPPGYGPDAPGWDPTRSLSSDLMSENLTREQQERIIANADRVLPPRPEPMPPHEFYAGSGYGQGGAQPPQPPADVS